MTWSQYEKEYTNLLIERQTLDRSVQQVKGKTVCFLYSEDKPHYGHRRLLAEYIQENYPVQITVCHHE